ncbi:MAG TPA: lipopolysaccharide heptosyltransferase II [Candidatus Polarisedimenticolaceae bacterium]|nr:lipopolysaccharide heptosyltransferase II [Candidatus Polarisedimenticolaceae bacterium]
MNPLALVQARIRTVVNDERTGRPVDARSGPAGGARLLVVGPSWIGDMVMAQSLFLQLRRDDPSVTIDVVAPDWSRPILGRMPEIRRAIGLPVAHGRLGFAARWRIGRSLQGERYDRAIVMPKSWKSSLVPFFARVPVRTGYRGEQRFGLINDARPLDVSFDRPMVRRYLALAPRAGGTVAEEIPRPALRVDRDNRGRVAARLGLASERPVVACVPGAEYGPAKTWPAESFGELGRRLTASGVAVWILGGAAERETGERVRALAGPRARNLCGELRLEDAVDLLSLTSTVVSNDTGLMHVAAAVGSHVVALYGSSSPVYTPPLTDRAEVLYLGLDCSPCFERACPLGHHRCLRELSVDAVLAAVRRVSRTLRLDRGLSGT